MSTHQFCNERSCLLNHIKSHLEHYLQKKTGFLPKYKTDKLASDICDFVRDLFNPDLNPQQTPEIVEEAKICHNRFEANKALLVNFPVVKGLQVLGPSHQHFPLSELQWQNAKEVIITIVKVIFKKLAGIVVDIIVDKVFGVLKEHEYLIRNPLIFE